MAFTALWGITAERAVTSVTEVEAGESDDVSFKLKGGNGVEAAW